MDERKKFVLISPKNRTAYNFRGDLLKKIKSKGYDVTVTGPISIGGCFQRNQNE